jgi:hypothetical protein
MKLNSLSRTAVKKIRFGTVGDIAREQTSAGSPSRQNTERIFFAAAGGFLFMMMLLGFQQFYLHGKAFPDHPIFPPLKGLLTAHGVAMTCWMTLFVVQTLLVVNNHVRTHMLLGLFGIAIAACVLIFGSWAAIATTRLEPELIRDGLNRRQFMIVPLSDMLKFGTFVTIAVWNRHRPDIHRPMMLLATLTMISAAAGRIPAIHNFYASTIWEHWFGAFFPKLLIGAGFLLVNTMIARRINRWFAGGFTVLVLASLLIWQIAPTEAWERIARFLTN